MGCSGVPGWGGQARQTWGLTARPPTARELVGAARTGMWGVQRVPWRERGVSRPGKWAHREAQTAQRAWRMSGNGAAARAGQRFREVTERWRSLENLCKGRMSERTSEWWQDKHAELPGGVGTGLQGRAGGVRGRHARARAGERPGLGHVPLLSLSTDSWAGAEGGSSSGSSGRRRPSLRGASVAEAGGHETWSTSGCRLNIFLLLNVPFFPPSTQYKLLPKDEV